MDTLTILFAAASIEILALLFGWAIIGYVTAWLYYKLRSAKKIRTLENENAELGRDFENLKNDKGKMYNTSHEREITGLIKKIQALQALHTEDVHETDENKSSEQRLYEKDKTRLNIAQSESLG